MAALTIRNDLDRHHDDDDRQHRHLEPGKSYDDIKTSHSSRQKKKHSRSNRRKEGHAERRPSGGHSRPDPPASLATAGSRPLRRSRGNYQGSPEHASSMRHLPTTSQAAALPIPTRQLDRYASMPAIKCQEGKESKAKRDQPSKRLHRRHRHRHERRRSQSFQQEENHLKKSVVFLLDQPKSEPNSPFSSQDDNSTVPTVTTVGTLASSPSLTASQKIRAEELDEFDRLLKPQEVQPRPEQVQPRERRTRPRKPTKSSSFQSRPSQLLQVYKDLALQKKQQQQNSRQGCRAVGTRVKKEKETLSTDVLVDDAATMFKSLTASGSSRSTVMPIYESDGRESESDESGADSLTVQRDENDSQNGGFFQDLSQDYNNSKNNTSPIAKKMASEKTPVSNTYDRQGSAEGHVTLVTIASTNSEATGNNIADLRSSQFSNVGSALAEELLSSCHTYEDDQGDECVATANDEGNQDLEATVPIQSPSFPPSINEAVLQKQLQYLRNDDDEPNTFNESNVSLSPISQKNQLIIYQSTNHMHMAPVHNIEQTFRDIKKRREIAHASRSAHGRNRKSFDKSNGRRLSL